MEKYDGLLLAVANDYSIKKGTIETENDWKVRLVYSICGMMAYASLWDNLDLESVSIVHLKKKVHTILINYVALYPELSSYLPCDNPGLLEDEITNQFLRAGVVYHHPKRVAPSIKREEPYNNVIFQRGIALDDISCVSGIGFYAKQDNTASPAGVKAMFGLERKNLEALWSATLSTALWETNLTFEQETEFLRLKPLFSQGCWAREPDTTGVVSILRTGLKGSRSYYLYRYSGTVIEASPLPQWKVESNNFRSLACACLFSYGTLPRIKYFEDGALVHIHLGYLLPPHELGFLKLVISDKYVDWMLD